MYRKSIAIRRFLIDFRKTLGLLLLGSKFWGMGVGSWKTFGNRSFAHIVSVVAKTQWLLSATFRNGENQHVYINSK